MSEPTKRVAGKSALISGGARGQGASHAMLLAENGAAVVIGDVLDEQGEATAAAIRERGLTCSYVHLDVTSASDWESAVAKVVSEHGKLDVLVNNAGIGGSFGSVEDTSEEEWAMVIAVNQTGVFLGMRAAAAELRRSGNGSIINTSSTMGVTATPRTFAYHATKAAIRHMTKCAAMTLAPDVRVNCVVPGLVATDFLGGIDESALAARAASYPLRRIGTATEISQAVLFLASDESAYMTGTDLVLDGGALAGFSGYSGAAGGAK
jgi:NAD(P)-dependent dehydrogenase (short-subunit alcohol dehydrogenase family)